MNLFSKKENEEKTAEKKPQSLGERISCLRKKHGYTQEEFSALLDVTPQAVSKWENDASCPDIGLLPKIADIFSVTLDELLTGKNPTEKAEENQERKDINIDKLKLVINVLKPYQKPVKVTLPLSVIKRVAKVGVNISGIIGQNVITSSQLEQILSLVDEGVTGTILDVVTEDDTHVIIEIE